MNSDFTLLVFMQHYPYYRQIQMISRKDLLIDDDVANFLPTTEQQVSKEILDNIYAYASRNR
jgi:hypothetical protein